MGSAHARYWSSGCVTSMVTSTRSPTLTGTDELPEGGTGTLGRSITDVTVLMPSADVPSSDGGDPQAKAAKVSARSPTAATRPITPIIVRLFTLASARSQFSPSPPLGEFFPPCPHPDTPRGVGAIGSLDERSIIGPDQSDFAPPSDLDSARRTPRQSTVDPDCSEDDQGIIRSRTFAPPRFFPALPSPDYVREWLAQPRHCV